MKGRFRQVGDMTFERKIVVGLEDIKAITFECANKECRSRLTVSPDKLIDFPQKCPRCSLPWIQSEPSTYSNADSAIPNFLRGITKIRSFLSNGLMGVRILMEFEEPD